MISFDEIPNIQFKKPKKNPTIHSDSSIYEIPFYKDKEYFANIDNFTSFVTAVKQMVRSSQDYKKYIAYIKNDVGLRACQVLSNIQEDDDSTESMIEMHHGPILTIFDIIHIMTDHLLAHGEELTTFKMANLCLQEHFDNNVQVVMLTETAHEQVHAGELFINLKQGFGDINRFLHKYKDGLSREHIIKITNYIEKSRKYESFDNGVFDLVGVVTNWNKKNS